jgi:hypothetical protein
MWVSKDPFLTLVEQGRRSTLAYAFGGFVKFVSFDIELEGERERERKKRKKGPRPHKWLPKINRALG